MDIKSDKQPFLLQILGSGVPALAMILAVAVMPVSVSSQTKEQIKQQAESRLRGMTPEEIDAKIRQFGMTRDQAEAKAREYGVDLQSYLQMRDTLAVPPAAAAPSTSIQVQPDTTGRAAPSVTVQLAPGAAPPAAPPIARAVPVGPEGLPYFGYNVFANVPSAFEPTASGPVDPEYLVGPDDVLRITVWGEVEMQDDLQVDKEGRVIIPTVGPVLVSGLTLDQATKTLLRQMSRSYAGLVASPPRVWLDVTLARLRPKRIFLMGDVWSPGGYTVSSYSTVFNSLYSIGGPTAKGSLRDVRVIRSNKVIAHIDLYTYFTGADKNNDMRVQDNDIIFVPPRGKTVAIRGEVRHPAIFELLPGENLRKLLDYAGGALATSYLERAEVQRIVPFDQRRKGELEKRIVDVDFRSVLDQGKDFTLADADTVTVFSVLDLRKDFVHISGSVYRPGRYQLEKGMTFRDLIVSADSLRPEAYRLRADLQRMRPDSTLIAIHVNLDRVMSGDPADDLPLEPLDQVRVYSRYEIQDRRTVAIRGHVQNPADYPYADSLTLYDLVFKAGGLDDSLYRARTYLERADLFRLNPDGITKRVIPFNLGRLLQKDPSVNRPLLPEDLVVVYEIEVSVLQNRFIDVKGSVRRPGRYPLASNMTLEDAIILAGGYTETAWTLEAEICRVERRGMGEDSLGYIRFADLPDLSDTAAIGREENSGRRRSVFRLQHRDIIFVRPNPEFRTQRLVSLGGEAKFPGEYALKVRNERLSSIIQRAGGLNKEAFLEGGRIIRGTSRVNVDFAEATDDPGGKHDFIMHAGDSIHIPAKPNSVIVTGEVNNPGILGYIAGGDLHNYIDRAGGLADSADYILVTFPNGNVERHGTGWFASDPTIQDGSIIIVKRVPPPPPEGQKVDIAGTIKDIFAITASVVTVLVLARQVK